MVQCAATASGWCNRAPSEALSGRYGAEVVTAGLMHDLQSKVNATDALKVLVFWIVVDANVMQ